VYISDHHFSNMRAADDAGCYDDVAQKHRGGSADLPCEALAGSRNDGIAAWAHSGPHGRWGFDDYLQRDRAKPRVNAAE